MKLTQTKIETSEVTRIVDIKCNKCGDSCKVAEEFKPAVDDYYGLIEVEVVGGYYSTHLADGTIYNFSLCEKCLSKLFESFLLPVDCSTFGPPGLNETN